jgi:lysophospholipase L1-like esterase
MRRKISRLAAALCLLLSFGLAQEARAGQTYLSLGDSIGFGETVFQNNSALGAYSDPSYGTNRGFVAMYANYLAAQNGGIAPTVVNLAVDGETSSSFFSGVNRVPPASGFTDASLAQLNLNYTGATPPTQASLLASTIAAQTAAGNIITNVSISLGSNDLYYLALHDPNAVADLPAALAAFQSNYESILTEIHASLPSANIYLLGSYNPYLTGAPTSPFAPLADYAVPLLNDTIEAVASEFKAKYVDDYDTVLTTDAAAYTLINEGDPHPNFDTGYAVIAGQIEAASVPEPSSLALLAVGLGGLIARSIVRRRRIAL